MLKFSSRFLTPGLTLRFNSFNGSLQNYNLSSSSSADVVVAGGGMVGSAAAAALAKLGNSISRSRKEPSLMQSVCRTGKSSSWKLLLRKRLYLPMSTVIGCPPCPPPLWGYYPTSEPGRSCWMRGYRRS